MPRYTQARLEYALRVFRDSSPYRTKRGFKTDNLEQHLKKYALRTTASMNVAQRSSLWIDKDDSGDYNPSKSKKRQADIGPPKPRNNNKRKEKDLGADRESGGPFKKAKAKPKPKTTWLSGRNRGWDCKILLKLTSVAGKAKLQQLADAGIPPPEVDDQPSLWALRGGSFSRSPRSPLTVAARRRSMFGPEPDGDEENEDLQGCGLGLRTRTLPVLEVPNVPQKSMRCVRCQQARRKCTHRKEDIGPSCTQCRRDGLECSFGAPYAQEEKAAQVAPGDQHDSPIMTKLPQIQQEKAEQVAPGDHHVSPVAVDSPSSGCSGTRWITTNFVHPINFKFSVAQDPTKTCDFCRDFRYGIVGCGSPRKVEVIVEGKRIIEEARNGYRAKGKEPSKMCIMCALDRFQICRCGNHEIVPIAGLCSGDFDYRQAFHNFSTPGVPAFNHWCNICISPAFFACGAPQQYSKVGRRIAQGARMEKGCGLFVCSACAIALDQVGMDRAKLEEQVKMRGSWKVRADMEFLFHGSDLHNAYYPS